MAVTVTHAKVSGVADGSDSALVQPSDWNANHVISGLGSGTSFPVSPATSDRFFRTDRNIEYFYDGTRWLSMQLFLLYPAPETGSINPITGGGNNGQRVANPFWNQYDIYVEKIQVTTILTNATTGTNYFTIQAQTGDGASAANLGSAISTQNDTQNARTAHTATLNTVVSSTVESIEFVFTEAGVATLYSLPVVTCRAVG